MTQIFGAWGFGSAAIYLLDYVGVKYQRRLYKWNSGFDWREDRVNFGLDFPRLPYYIDEDIKVSGELPILRHLARKHGLDGAELSEQAKLDVFVTTIKEWQQADRECNKIIEEHVKELHEEMKLLDEFLGPNKFTIGDRITYADFVLFEYLHYCSSCTKDESFEAYPALKQFYESFASLECIAQYTWLFKNKQEKNKSN